MTTIKLIGALIVGYLLSPDTSLASCQINFGYPITITYSIKEPLSIPLDTPNGTLIASITGTGGRMVGYRCSSNIDPAGIKSASGETPIDDIIPFGNTGLGYNMSSGGGKEYIYPYYEDFRNDPNNTRTDTPYVLHIYKIGPIKEVVKIPSGIFANYVAGSKTIYSATLAESIGVAIGSCEILTSNVLMGEHLTSDFTGAGHTTKPISFSIKLNKCTGKIREVKYKITPAHGWINSTLGVIGLEKDSVKGLGIQITKDGIPVNPANNNTLAPPKGASETYDFAASYYQASNKIESGSANSSLTIEISYL